MPRVLLTPTRILSLIIRRNLYDDCEQAAAVSTKVVCASPSWMPGSKHPAHLDGR